MANAMAQDDFMVELLHAEKLRLMERLDKTQRKMKAEFNTEDAAELGRIADSLQKVCKRLEVNADIAHTGSTASVGSTSTPDIQPKYEPAVAEDQFALPKESHNLSVEVLSSAVNSFRENGFDDSSTTTTDRIIPRTPDLTECRKCQRFMAWQPSGDNQYCPNCNDEIDRTAMPSPFAAFRNVGRTSHKDPHMSSLSMEEERTLSLSGLPMLRNVIGSPDPYPQHLDIGQTTKERADNLPAPQTHHERSTLSKMYTTKRKSALSDEIPQVCPGTKYTHLVEIDGKRVELVCYVCGANCKYNHLYFDGARGYSKHVHWHDSEAGVEKHEIIERAKNRGGLLDVDDADIARINDGKDPIHVRPPYPGNKQIQNKKPNKGIAIGQELVNGAPLQLGQHSALYEPQNFDQLDKDRYPTVVLINGAWFTISCHVCGTNVCPDKTSKAYGWFLDGLESLASHMVLKHEIITSREEFEAKDWSTVANLCHGVELSDEDVMRIKKGGDPKTSIVKMVSFDQTLEQAALKESTLSLSNIEQSTLPGNTNRDTDRPSPRITTPRGGSFFQQFSAKTAASMLPNAPPSQTLQRRHAEFDSQHKTRSENRISGTAAYGRLSSRTALQGTSPTEYEEMQGIVASAKKGVDYVTPGEKRNQSKRRKRASIDYSYDGGSSQSESSEEEPLARRRTRSFVG